MSRIVRTSTLEASLSVSQRRVEQYFRKDPVRRASTLVHEYIHLIVRQRKFPEVNVTVKVREPSGDKAPFKRNTRLRFKKRWVDAHPGGKFRRKLGPLGIPFAQAKDNPYCYQNFLLRIEKTGED